jgi:predicted RNA methylase
VYDSLPSSYIEVEEPTVHAILDGLAPGVALDAACGTGRQTRALTARGHRRALSVRPVEGRASRQRR